MKLKKYLMTLLVSLLVVAMVLSLVACQDDKKEPTVTLDKTTATMNVWDSLQLTATAENTEESIKWATSDGKLATVSDSGLVQALAKGTVTITATAGTASATCVITINADDTSPVIVVSETDVLVAKGGTYDLSVHCTWKGETITDAITYAWALDDGASDAVATVTESNNGANVTINGLDYGTTRFIVSAQVRGVIVAQVVNVQCKSVDLSFSVGNDLVPTVGGYIANVGLESIGDALTSIDTQVKALKSGVEVANATITWNNDYDKDVISFENGIITALKEGTTTLVASYEDIFLTITVNVYRPEVTLAKRNLSFASANPTVAIDCELIGSVVSATINDVNVYSAYAENVLTLVEANIPDEIAVGEQGTLVLNTDRVKYIIPFIAYERYIGTALDVTGNKFVNHGEFDNPTITMDRETLYDDQATIKLTIGRLHGDYIESGFWITGIDAQSVDYVQAWVKTDMTGSSNLTTWWTSPGLGTGAVINGEWTLVRFDIAALKQVNIDIPGQVDFSNGLFLRVTNYGGEANIGKSVWFSSITAGKYGEAVVTKVGENADNFSMDKEVYNYGDTVTLTAKTMDNGTAINYYLVNGKRIQGNTFVIDSLNNTVEAVFAPISETCHIVYGEVTSQLVDGKVVVPAFKVVDGMGNVATGYEVVISAVDQFGNELVVADGKVTLAVSGAHTITIIYSCASLSAENQTRTVDVSFLGANGVIVDGNSNLAVIECQGDAYTLANDNSVLTPDGQPSIRIQLPTSGSVSWLEASMLLDANIDVTEFQYIEYWVKVSVKRNDPFRLFSGADNRADAPGTEWVRYRYEISSLAMSNGKIKFTLLGGGAVFGDTVWVSGFVLSNREQVNFVIDDDQKELISVAPVMQDQTATISLDETKIAEGFKFSHFLVDGRRIEGNTFLAWAKSHTVKAVIVDLTAATELVLDGEPADLVKVDSLEYTLIPAIIKNVEGTHLSNLVANVQVTDNIGNTYEVVDGKVTLLTKSTIKLTVTYSYAGCESVSYSVTVQSSDGIVVAADEYASNALLEKAWDAVTISYDADTQFAGKGTIKVQTTSTENGFRLPAFDSKSVDYIDMYVYSESAITIGTWWGLGSDIPANTWTLVRFDLDTCWAINNIPGALFEMPEGKFIVRIMTNTTIWFSDITAGTYGPVELTKTGSNQDVISFDKESYVQEENVTITIGNIPVGFALSKLLVNGEEVTVVDNAYTFKAREKAYTVEVVLLDKTLTYHVVCDSTNLTFTGNSLTLPTALVKDGNGEVVADFTAVITSVVDQFGNELVVNDGVATLIATGAHKITVTYTCSALPADRGVLVTNINVINDKGIIIDANNLAGISCEDAGNTLTFAPEKDETVLTPDGQPSIKVAFGTSTMGWVEALMHLPYVDLSNYEYIEFWAKVDRVEGDPMRVNIGADNKANPVQTTWTRYRFDVSSFIGTTAIDGEGRIRVQLLGGSACYNSTLWISNFTLSTREDVNVVIDSAYAGILSVATVKQDQTATIVVDETKLPEGKSIDYYTVDGVRIQGNTFVAWAKSHVVSAELIDLNAPHHITLDDTANAITTVDGLSYTLIGASIQNSQGDNLAVLPSVTVVDSLGNSYTPVEGVITLATKTSVSITVTYSYEGLLDVSYTTRLFQADGTLIAADNYATVTNLPLAWWQDSGTTISASDGVINVVPGTAESGFLAPLTQSDWNASPYVWVTMQVKSSASGTTVGGYWYGGQDVGTDWTTVTLKISACNDWNTNGNRFAIRIMNAVGITMSFKDIKVVTASEASFTVLDATDVAGKYTAGGFDAGVTCATDETVTYNDKATIKVSFGSLYSGYLESGFALPAFAKGNYDYVEFYAKSSGASFTLGTWWSEVAQINGDGWTKVRLTFASADDMSAGGYFIRIIKSGASEADLAENVWISDIVVGFYK